VLGVKMEEREGKSPSRKRHHRDTPYKLYQANVKQASKIPIHKTNFHSFNPCSHHTLPQEKVMQGQARMSVKYAYKGDKRLSQKQENNKKVQTTQCGCVVWIGVIGGGLK